MRLLVILLLVGCSSLESKRECRVTCEGCKADRIEMFCDGSIEESDINDIIKR